MGSKATRPTSGKPARPAWTTGLEEYVQNTQRSFDEDIARAQTAEERRGWITSRKISFWELDCAKKYRLTPSALAMIARLKPDRGSGRITTLPGTGVWLVLDNPEMSNLYFSSIPQAAISYVESHPHTVLDEKWQKVVSAPWQWTLDIMQLGKHPVSYAYHAERGLWTLNMPLCYAGQCEMTGKDAQGWPGWYICPECRPAFDFWTSWFPVALMAINGDFAETEERREPQIIKAYEPRGTRRGQHSGTSKYDEKPVAHSWHVVTFDISVKSLHSHPEESQEHEPLHPTWLERAIADEAVVYVAKHIQETQRTFRHERYVNMRGKTIDVRSYDKRVPMSVKHLKQSIYRAVAQKEE